MLPDNCAAVEARRNATNTNHDSGLLSFFLLMNIVRKLTNNIMIKAATFEVNAESDLSKGYFIPVL